MTTGAGRPPLPRAQHELRGDAGKRHASERPEPVGLPLAKLPPAPVRLSEKDDPAERGRKVLWRRLWKQHGEYLVGQRLLREGDLIYLEVLVDLWVEYRLAVEPVRKAGPEAYVQETPNGYRQIDPSFTVLKGVRADLYRFLRESGLTPSARARVFADVAPAEEEDEFEALKRKQAEAAAAETATGVQGE